jgi:hypothetical protein
MLPAAAGQVSKAWHQLQAVATWFQGRLLVVKKSSKQRWLTQTDVKHTGKWSAEQLCK